MRHTESFTANVPDEREYKDGDFVKVIWSKNHRIVKEPRLDVLKDAPPSPHVEAGTSTEGRILENNDGFWLQFIDSLFISNYIWLSKSDIVKRF